MSGATDPVGDYLRQGAIVPALTPEAAAQIADALGRANEMLSAISTLAWELQDDGDKATFGKLSAIIACSEHALAQVSPASDLAHELRMTADREAA